MSPPPPPLDLTSSSMSAYLVKGKQRASEQDLEAMAEQACAQYQQLRLTTSPLHRRKRSQSADVSSSFAVDPASLSSGAKAQSRRNQPLPPPCNAPASLRTATPSAPSTGSANQYVSLLGQPAAVSASISIPDKLSATAAIPSLYKAGRGRSINRSPTRRWDRRGASASANVLNGDSAGESGDEFDNKLATASQSNSPRIKDVRFQSRAARPSSLASNADTSLFSSDEEDSPLLSSGDDVNADTAGKRLKARTRRWSSVERDRRRGLRILLYERSVGADADAASPPKHIASIESKSSRRMSMESDLSLGEPEEISEAEASSVSSRCSSSADLNHQVASDIGAIPIQSQPGRRRGRRQPAEAASSHDCAPSSSTEVSTRGLSYVTSTPSTSLLHSPPGFIQLKSLAALPVSTDADPLLSLTTPSIEELIQIDQVEFLPEEAVVPVVSSPIKGKKKASPNGKTSWVIGDFESEPDSDDEPAQTEMTTQISISPPTPSSYQARLASLQSQLRTWSRGEEPTPPRTRQTSAGSEEAEEPRDKDSTSLLSASWRNLARLPNLIMLPGLGARQLKESLSTSKSPPKADSFADRLIVGRGQDFANIFRRATSTQSPQDDQSIEDRRVAALKTGLPNSPSPGSSPAASIMGSRKSSNDSVTSIKPGAPRKGRGVATPLEADRDPSAYVSGLGQPIDPDTELSSVVHLQTFRSRSKSKSERSKSAAVPAARALEQTSTPPSPRKSTALHIVIPSTPDSNASWASKGLFESGPTPLDTASAPTSPTYHKTRHGESSGDEGRSLPPTPQTSPKMEPSDGERFRGVRRRNRQRLSGPRSSRPRVEAPVPNGFSAFSLDGAEAEEKNESESDGEQTPRATRGRHDRSRRGRDSSPPRSSRQCAVGLFGGGSSSSALPSLGSASRSRRGLRDRNGPALPSNPIRSSRSSPDLTYAAAVAQAAAAFENQQAADAEGAPSLNDLSPPRGSRGRRGAVKVVAASVGQWPMAPRPLLPPGVGEGLRRGPSYPPRADQMLDDAAVSPDHQTMPDIEWSSPSAAPVASPSAQAVRSRSSNTSAGFGSPPLHALRFRLLSNSSHLLMLSLELDMIKKQKISAPLKPRWGKHRANDFNPLPSPMVTSKTASEEASKTTAASPSITAMPSRWDTNTRDPGSKLRFSFSSNL